MEARSVIKFTDNHAARLAQIAPGRVRPALADQLVDHAHAIAEGAAFSIRDGAISGAGHVPSQPFSPPNADTHDLDLSIHAGELIETPGEIRTSVIADSDHAWLELGGANVAERPYLGPEMRRQHGSTIRGLVGAMNRTIRGA
jgi:hypothetical protein